MNLFAENDSKASNGVTQLDHTARLTQQSADLAREVIQITQKQEEVNKAHFAMLIQQSMKDHDMMDNLIEQTIKLDEEDVDYLKSSDDGLIERMIKSQQSKRSRSKGKVMTMDNYIVMLTGAIAENLLRIASNKPKNATGFTSSGLVLFSAAALEDLEKDKDKLGKAIRNIQSKKSIARSKRDFDETGEKWLNLLEAEAQLKAIRGESSDAGTNAKIVVTAYNIKELLRNKDVNMLKGPETKALLAEIMTLIHGKQATKDNTHN